MNKKKKMDEMEENMKMRIYKLIILILIFVLVFSSAYLLFINSNSNLLSIKEYDADVIIDKNVTGFNLNSDAIHFGRIGPGGSSTREIIIKNELDKEQIVSVTSTGKLKGMVTSEPNNFLLFPNETKNIELILFANSTKEEGYYDGKVKIYFYKNE